MLHDVDVNIKRVLLNQVAANRQQARKDIINKRLGKIISTPPPPGIHSKHAEFENKLDKKADKYGIFIGRFPPRGQGTNQGF